MTAVDCLQDKVFCSKKNITTYPSYHIYKNGKFSRSFDADTIEDFVNALSGKPPIPKLEFGEEVKVGTHWNIDDLISSNDRTLVLFYAPWCGHCKNVKPEFSKAAKQMKKANYIALDCTRYQGACKRFGVTSYPSLKIFVAGKFYANYAGERTTKGFINAFNQNRNLETPKQVKDFKISLTNTNF
uniref:Thioredoxin domain-containing protein n=1 Tax=Panagrolaimus superbus TaxID=310955 RepID=A0A914Z4B4_9BILA